MTWICIRGRILCFHTINKLKSFMFCAMTEQHKHVIQTCVLRLRVYMLYILRGDYTSIIGKIICYSYQHSKMDNQVSSHSHHKSSCTMKIKTSVFLLPPQIFFDLVQLIVLSWDWSVWKKNQLFKLPALLRASSVFSFPHMPLLHLFSCSFITNSRSTYIHFGVQIHGHLIFDRITSEVAIQKLMLSWWIDTCGIFL